MSNKDQSKQILDENHQWPCPYLFKFIVPTKNICQLTELFPNDQLQTRASKNGKYTSVTFESNMSSSKEVMEVYQKASTIPGVMSL